MVRSLFVTIDICRSSPAVRPPRYLPFLTFYAPFFLRPLKPPSRPAGISHSYRLTSNSILLYGVVGDFLEFFSADFLFIIFRPPLGRLFPPLAFSAIPTFRLPFDLKFSSLPVAGCAVRSLFCGTLSCINDGQERNFAPFTFTNNHFFFPHTSEGLFVSFPVRCSPCITDEFLPSSWSSDFIGTHFLVSCSANHVLFTTSLSKSRMLFFLSPESLMHFPPLSRPSLDRAVIRRFFSL